MCLSCIAITPPAEPNRERYVQQLLHSLPAHLQQLAPQDPNQLTAQQAEGANAAAEKGLRHARTLMMFMQSWKDSRQDEQSQPKANPAAQLFISCWPLVQQALASGHASVAVQERTAACCTAAVRMHLAASMPALPGMLHAAGCGIAGGHDTAHVWVPVLATVLDHLEDQPLSQVIAPLSESLSIIDNSAAAQSLTDKRLADSKTDFSLVCAHVEEPRVLVAGLPMLMLVTVRQK